MKNPKIGNVILSPRAAEFLKAKAHWESLPDIRPDRVNRLKQMIKNGTYTIDSRRIAYRMIKEGSYTQEF